MWSAKRRVAPEVLRAPIDGVMALSRVVAGQVVQAQDVLFQIVDPEFAVDRSLSTTAITIPLRSACDRRAAAATRR